MKPTLAFLGLVGLVLAIPQDPPEDPPELPPPADDPPAPTPPPEDPGEPGDDPPPSTILTPPAPTETGAPGQGPICQCGYTYCASVLMAMKVPWSEDRLAEAYCSTPNAACSDGSEPSNNVTESLFICLCDGENDDLGTDLDLLCGCDACLVLGPDYRGRCQTPCSSGSCHSKSDGGGGWFPWATVEQAGSASMTV